jgi:NAD(P)H-dependent FMN reductase
MRERLRLAVIVASVRKGRFGPVVADWFIEHARERSDVDLDVVDLLEVPEAAQGWVPNTPREPRATFAERVAAADGFVVVTPEYNHSFPSGLKAAIDALHAEWQAKPVGFVSYGGISGGLRAVEQLRLVVAELHMVSLRETISFHNAGGLFDASGRAREAEGANAAAKLLLDQWVWWARALHEARAARSYSA